MSIVVVNTEYSSTVLSDIDEACQQQAAVDLRLENVWKMEGLFIIDEEKKQHRTTTKLEVGDDGYFYLDEGSFEISFNHNISIGADEASLIVPRSTLARNGVFVSSGLWDPKFNGRGGCCLHVRGGPMKIKPGTRIGQFVTWKVLNAQGAYNGSYGLNPDGTPKQMEAKYHSGA